MKRIHLIAGLLITTLSFGSFYACDDGVCDRWQQEQEAKKKAEQLEARKKELMACKQIYIRASYSPNEFSCGCESTYVVPLEKGIKSSAADIKAALLKHAPHDKTYASDVDRRFFKPAVTEAIVQDLKHEGRYRLIVGMFDHANSLAEATTLEQLVAAKKFDPTKEVMLFSKL